MYAATTERSIAMAILAIVVVVWAIYVFVNIRQSKRELGSEAALAANRGAMPDDEELEGPRLEKVQAYGVLFLLIIALVLPIYWIREGGRRAGAERGFENRAFNEGEALYATNCINCHGADLGGSEFPPVVLDIGYQFSDQESFLVNGNWTAPQLYDVFKRFDTEIEDWRESEEVLQILTFGRGVMPAWGLEGGGAMNSQQVESVISYLWASQISDEEAQDNMASAVSAEMSADPSKSEGQVLFELNCARCHTPMWPAKRTASLPNNGGEVAIVPGPAGAGRYGPALNSVSLNILFPDVADHVAFISDGSADNVGYGVNQRLGNYGMPGFGRVLTAEELLAIAEYERSLNPADQVTVPFDDLFTAPEEDSE
ncbi:MAG: mono/diheme cytochrome c family protein [Candidatus Poriferisodalaceae bacterium]|jgi:mono/diheme cytochrome c family protein